MGPDRKVAWTGDRPGQEKCPNKTGAWPGERPAQASKSDTRGAWIVKVLGQEKGPGHENVAWTGEGPGQERGLHRRGT